MADQNVIAVAEALIMACRGTDVPDEQIIPDIQAGRLRDWADQLVPNISGRNVGA
jgi:hypothetical protein